VRSGDFQEMSPSIEPGSTLASPACTRCTPTASQSVTRQPTTLHRNLQDVFHLDRAETRVDGSMGLNVIPQHVGLRPRRCACLQKRTDVLSTSSRGTRLGRGGSPFVVVRRERAQIDTVCCWGRRDGYWTGEIIQSSPRVVPKVARFWQRER
jgi:hypothetical protein